MNIILVVGARPNFMKMAPLYFECKKYNYLHPIIVHTGQHYDFEMSQIFFEDLELPTPDYFLNVGSGSHAEQTAKIMIEFEKVLLNEKPDLVVVFGDVNSTLACSITTKKLRIPVAHVEAGLRSFDDTMPEEINRRLTDAVSDFLFTPSKDGSLNLIKEGVAASKIHFVGNIMIDSLMHILKKIDRGYEDNILDKFGLNRFNYALTTLHRPSNVDNEICLNNLLHALNNYQKKIPIIFPMHPRTKNNIQVFQLTSGVEIKFNLLAPLSYREFIVLEKYARLVLTDSGGIQEETTFLNIPCLTLRPNTERPITITEGTNELVDEKNIEMKFEQILSGSIKRGQIPELWDGNAKARILKIISESSQLIKDVTRN